MQIYLVGGAVRDTLLGLPVQERDWVVVGANPRLMLEQGYKQVGRDFPVFLHPETGEEYALARQERKTGAGYYGFDCDIGEAITLEQDLMRRDLTINAMAMDQHGRLIDPHNGLKDIENKCLRHVSQAFVEDPVRVLRVARFAARFAAQGFYIAPETKQLMNGITQRGELSYLVPERVWQEWQKSLTESRPSVFLRVLHEVGALAVIMPEIATLMDAETGYSAMLERMETFFFEPMVRFAMILGSFYDVGIYHEGLSLDNIKNICKRLRVPHDYQALALSYRRFYQSLSDVAILSAEEIVTTLELLHALREPNAFLKQVQMTEYGNLHANLAQQWILLMQICAGIPVSDVIAEGYSGAAIGQQLHQRRVEAVKKGVNK